MQLRREMMHPGGVRIQLRRKDCTASIAFVDAFGAAWLVWTTEIRLPPFQPFDLQPLVQIFGAAEKKKNTSG